MVALQKDASIFFRLTSKDKKRLETFAKKRGMSVSEVVRLLVLHGLKCPEVKKFF
jgi:antitoxin component of RelBE/YafQ-DinJ toxin-antitoxin module